MALNAISIMKIRKGDTIRKEYYNGVTNTKEAIEYIARFDQDDKHSWIGSYFLITRHQQVPTVPGVYVTDDNKPYRRHRDGHWSYGSADVWEHDLAGVNLMRVFTDTQDPVPF